MNYKDKIIDKISAKTCNKVGNIIRRKLQKMNENMQSREDSVLDNIWDEICVQVQTGYSFYWEQYLDVVMNITKEEVKKLDGVLQEVIWLQTEQGMEWDEESNTTIPVCIEEIAEYIVQNVILEEASRWSNSRINKYIETGYAG